LALVREIDPSHIAAALPPCPSSGVFHNCFGTFTSDDGHKYVGEWKDDKMHGSGTYTFGPGDHEGDKFIGEWKDNKPWQGVEYSPSGEVKGTFSNGEWCEECEPTASQLALVREIDPAYIVGSADSCTSNPDSAACEEIGSRSESGLRLIGTGTGFVINPDYVVTADHVLEGCNQVAIVHAHKKTVVQTVARDRSNDLGLLRLDKAFLHTAKLRGGSSIRLGERVSNYGYPLFGDISTSATITEGNINNLSGVGNDSTVMQFDAPTQPGNSGGPLLDSSGNVVGVVIYILSKEYADATGHIAQNVNFAVKSTIVENFLQSHNVQFEEASPTEQLDLPDLAEKAETFTVLVECWQ
jgi:S1-C subfamily serine protease